MVSRSPTPLSRLREIRDRQRAAEKLTPERDELIRQAAGEGNTEGELALAAGLSQSRVSEIIHR